MATPEEGMASMIRNLAEKTGKSLDQWLKIARATKLPKHGLLVNHLKEQHGLTHGYANQIALRALASNDADTGDDSLIDQQYAGAKAPLRPVYEALIRAVKKFGSDVEISSKK